MPNLIKIIALFSCTSSLYSQPYFDAVLVKGTISPDAGIWRRNNRTIAYKHFIAGATIPMLIKSDSSKFIISAFTERWAIKANEISDVPNAVQALYVPVSYVKPNIRKMDNRSYCDPTLEWKCK